MPLEILVIMVVVGVSAVVLSVYFSGGSGIEPILDESTVRERLDVDFSPYSAEQIFITDDKMAALAFPAEDGSSPAIILPLGQNHLTRLLMPGQLKLIAENGNELELDFHDFTIGRHLLAFSKKEIREQLVARLEASNKG